jgi:hypothetical protein
MATLRRFEGIEAWKMARELTCVVYSCSKVGAFAPGFRPARSNTPGGRFSYVKHLRRI